MHIDIPFVVIVGFCIAVAIAILVLFFLKQFGGNDEDTTQAGNEQCQVPEGYGVPTGNGGEHCDPSKEIAPIDKKDDDSDEVQRWRENGAL